MCNTDVDCLVGTCLDDGGTGPDNGDNLHLCTTTCASDDDCSKFDSAQGLFVCNTETPPHHCATPNAYRGASCNTDADCVRDRDSHCMRSSPTDKQGTCLHACDSTGGCLPRGGINQTCLPLLSSQGPLPICLPGIFGYPCQGDNNCVGGLSCRGAGPSPTSSARPCARTTATAPTIAGRSAAGAARPMRRSASRPSPGFGRATRDAMCDSGVCDQMTHKCAPAKS